MADVNFKYAANKGATAPTNADENTLYLTNGRLYKGNVLIADKSPDTYTWNKITAKPTTLDGYGIVDGATQSGYYPNMRVGLADDLGDIEERVDSEYMMQPTAKDENIRDGYAHIESLKGNSVVWNQYARKLDSSYASYYHNVALSDVAVSANNTLQCDITELGKVEYYIDYMFQYKPNHKYLALLDIKSYTTTSGLYVYYNTSLTLANKRVSSINQWETLHLMFTPTESSASTRFRLYGGLGSYITETGTIYFRNPQIIDLTQMFGQGNEPTTIEEFNARKPQVADEYAYNEGEIISFNGDAIKSVGFNQFDKDSVEKGYYYSPNLTKYNDSNISTIKIRVLPQVEYYTNIYAHTNVWSLIWLDKNNQVISQALGSLTDNIGTTKLSPANAYYAILNVANAGLDSFVFNLSNPAKNGNYEPCRQFTRNLPRRGELRSAGTAYDEIYYNHDIRKYVKVTRMGEVDLGDLTWNIASNGPKPFFKGRVTGGLSTLGVGVMPNMIVSKKYNVVVSGYDATVRADKSITWQRDLSVIMLYDYDYTDAESLKASLQGVKLIYELAEPIETVLSDVEYMDYYVENGGTEQVLSENNTTPIRTTTVYNFDAVSTIRQNRFDVSELKSGYSSLSNKVSTAETNISNLTSYVAQNTTSIDNIVNGTTAVGKANKLATPRTIWGQSFDGSGNVSGAMTGVTTINGGTPITSSNIGSQIVAQALELTDSNGNVTYTAEDITAIDNKFANYSPIEGSASLTKYSGGTFGNAAAKHYTTSVQSGNANLVTSGAVYTAIDNLRQEVRVAFPSMATLSAYSLNGSTLNCYIESEDNIDLWSDLFAGAVLFVVIQDGASVEGTFNKISAKYDGSSDTTEIAVRQSPGLYSGYGCILVSTGSLDISQGGISIVYPVAAS